MLSAFGVDHGEVSKAFGNPVKAARRAVGSKVYQHGEEKVVRAYRESGGAPHGEHAGKAARGHQLRRLGRKIHGF